MKSILLANEMHLVSVSKRGVPKRRVAVESNLAALELASGRRHPFRGSVHDLTLTDCRATHARPIEAFLCLAAHLSSHDESLRDQNAYIHLLRSMGTKLRAVTHFAGDLSAALSECRERAREAGPYLNDEDAEQVFMAILDAYLNAIYSALEVMAGVLHERDRSLPRSFRKIAERYEPLRIDRFPWLRQFYDIRRELGHYGSPMLSLDRHELVIDFTQSSELEIFDSERQRIGLAVVIGFADDLWDMCDAWSRTELRRFGPEGIGRDHRLGIYRGGGFAVFERDFESIENVLQLVPSLGDSAVALTEVTLWRLIRRDGLMRSLDERIAERSGLILFESDEATLALVSAFWDIGVRTIPDVLGEIQTFGDAAVRVAEQMESSGDGGHYSPRGIALLYVGLVGAGARGGAARVQSFYDNCMRAFGLLPVGERPPTMRAGEVHFTDGVAMVGRYALSGKPFVRREDRPRSLEAERLVSRFREAALRSEDADSSPDLSLLPTADEIVVLRGEVLTILGDDVEFRAFTLAATACMSYFLRAGQLADAIEVLWSALPLMRADSPPVHVARVVQTLSRLLHRSRAYDDAVAVLRDALSMLRDAEAPELRASMLNDIASSLFAKGDVDAAIQVQSTEELPIWETMPDRVEYVLSRVNLAAALSHRGRRRDQVRSEALLGAASADAGRLGFAEAESLLRGVRAGISRRRTLATIASADIARPPPDERRSERDVLRGRRVGVARLLSVRQRSFDRVRPVRS